MPKTITEKDIKKAYQNVFAGPDGELVLQDLRGACGIQKPSFVPGEADTTAHNEGMKLPFWYILDLLEIKEEDIEDISTTLTEDSNDG